MPSDDQKSTAPRAVDADKHVSARSVSFTYSAEVIPVDDVVTESSSTLKYLRLRNGDYNCYRAVFLVIDGERHEITMDALPEEGS